MDYLISSTRKKNTSADDRYTFIEIIGEGCYSKIWKATDNMSGKTVAIKEISKRMTSWKRFSKELKFGRKLSGHTNIVTTHNLAYETKSAYLLVQDFAKGGDLCSAIMLQGQIKEATCKTNFFQICSAVKHMHEHNLVHLDIKPDNVLLKDFSGSVVELVDFGLAERTGKKLRGACGTLSYMAPEALDADGLSVTKLTAKPSLDVWSLGVLLYSMLTGEYPWMQAVLSDQDFSKFCRWQVGVSHSPPEGWKRFTPQLCQLLRTLFAVDPRCRCKVQDIFSYFDKKWLIG